MCVFSRGVGLICLAYLGYHVEPRWPRYWSAYSVGTLTDISLLTIVSNFYLPDPGIGFIAKGQNLRKMSWECQFCRYEVCIIFIHIQLLCDGFAFERQHGRCHLIMRSYRV